MSILSIEGCRVTVKAAVDSFLLQTMPPYSICSGKQHTERTNRSQVRYVRDLRPYVGSISLAYRKGKSNEADPMSRRPDFKPSCHGGLYWTGDVLDEAETLDGVDSAPFIATIASMSVSVV